jgi:hypothetical protein
MCETNTQTDALHCGGCSNPDSAIVASCHLGAPCLDGGCGEAATQVAVLQSNSQTPVVANAMGVFWTDQGNVYWLAPSSGAPTTVATNIFTCGQATSFAVDGTSVYYFSNGTNCGPQAQCAGLLKAPLSGGTATVLVPASQNTNTECASLAVSVDGTALYWLTSLQQGNTASLTLASVSLTSGSASPTIVTTTESMNGSSSNRLVMTPTAAIFEANPTNNQTAFQIVPTSGGGGSVLSLPPSLQGFGAFTADSSALYVVGSSCSCDDNGGSSTTLPAGTVARVPIDGSSSSILTQFVGQAGDITLDPEGDNVYWSTDTTAWKVPVTGGTGTPVAGNLANGAPPQPCSGCGSPDTQDSTTIAVDASHIYLADHAANVNELLEAPR